MKHFVACLLVFLLCVGGAYAEVGFATPEEALQAWLLAIKEQDFARAASCFAAESVADNITEEVWTNGRDLPTLTGDGGNNLVVLVPHEAYWEVNVANLKARAASITMEVASALAAGPEGDYYSASIGYKFYQRYYPETYVAETLDVLHAADFQQLESLEIVGTVDAETYLLIVGGQMEELTAEIAMIVSAYGAQDARPVAVIFDIATHGRCMAIMYTLQYQDQWYLLGPSRLLSGTIIGLAGIGLILPD